MGALLNNPVALMLVAPAAAGLVIGGLLRLTASSLPASLSAPAVFLVAYVSTYQQVPSFPPLGSVNKIFYVAAFGTALGLLLDVATRMLGQRLPWALALRRGIEIAAPFAIAVWIGYPRFSDPDAGLLLTVLGLAVGGIAVLWRLATVGSADKTDGGEMVATALLAALALGFAPIALFGASSTSFGLCLGLAAGLAVAALVSLAAPRGFGESAVLGAGGGLLSVVDTVALITRQVDYAALAVLLAVLFAGQVGARFVLPQGRFDRRIRRVLIGLMAASPIPVIVAILILRHPNPLGT